MTQARESPVSRNKVSSCLHTCTPVYTYTSRQKTDQKINFQFVLLKGQAFHCFETMECTRPWWETIKIPGKILLQGPLWPYFRESTEWFATKSYFEEWKQEWTFQASTTWRADVSLAKTKRSGREADCLKWLSLEVSKEACGPGSHSRKLSAVYRPQKGLGISLLLPKMILRWFWVTTQTHMKPYWPSLFHISGWSSLGAFVLVLLYPQCLSCPDKKRNWHLYFYTCYPHNPQMGFLISLGSLITQQILPSRS